MDPIQSKKPDIKDIHKKDLSQKEVIIQEGKIEVIPPGKQAFYPEMDSCISITARLKDGTMIGAHLVQVPTDQQLQNDNIIEELKKIIQGREIEDISLLGDLEGWTAKELGGNVITGKGGGNISLYLAYEFNTENVSFGDARGHKLIVPDQKNQKPIVDSKQVAINSAFTDAFSFKDLKDFYQGFTE